MYGEWLRLTTAQLERAKSDPDWLENLAGYLDDGSYDDDPDKSWQALEYLLSRRGFPVQIIYGEEEFESDADWGYGPPRYLTPEQVRVAAAALDALSAEDLLTGVQQPDLAAANIYPAVWDRPGELEWAVSYFDEAKTFFEAAADAGDAVLCWIS
jgi:hypothetical protein